MSCGALPQTLPFNYESHPSTYDSASSYNTATSHDPSHAVIDEYTPLVATDNNLGTDTELSVVHGDFSNKRFQIHKAFPSTIYNSTSYNSEVSPSTNYNSTTYHSEAEKRDTTSTIYNSTYNSEALPSKMYYSTFHSDAFPSTLYNSTTYHSGIPSTIHDYITYNLTNTSTPVASHNKTAFGLKDSAVGGVLLCTGDSEEDDGSPLNSTVSFFGISYFLPTFARNHSQPKHKFH